MLNHYVFVRPHYCVLYVILINKHNNKTIKLNNKNKHNFLFKKGVLLNSLIGFVILVENTQNQKIKMPQKLC